MPLSLYLHFPFCKNHCSYCDFYKELYDSSLEERLFKSLHAEIDLAVEKFDLVGATAPTIFIGGGTPSMANLERLSQLIEKIKSSFNVVDEAEFSIECNPESVTLEKLTRWQELGINRPTFGIQSFDTKLLKLLGRKHKHEDSQRAIYFTNVLDYKNFGTDLIFGLPGQTTTMLTADINQLLTLEPPHVSFYQLTVEEGTVLYQKVNDGKLRLPDSDYMYALYKTGYEMLTEAGYERYEVSSFAKPGYQCQHNMNYWGGGDYLGLGPSAHSLINGKRFFSESNLASYLDKCDDGQSVYVEDNSNPRDRAIESIMVSLHTSAGLNRNDFEKRYDISFNDLINREQYNLLVESGHLIPDKGNLRLSDDGIFLVEEIVRRLIK